MIGNRPGAPLFATVNITGHCNLKCKYCFYHPRPYQHMTWENFRRVIDQLVELEVFFINISGGEPFVHPRFDTFVRYAHSKFRQVLTLTNGTILRANHIQTISEIVESKKEFSVQVSIDSITPGINRKTRGNVGKIKKNIQIYSEMGVRLMLAMVITRFNIDSAIESILSLSRYSRLFHLMAVVDRHDTHLRPSDDELARFWEKVIALREKHDLHINTPCDEVPGKNASAYGAPCMAFFSSLVIDPNLNVRPCDRCLHQVIGDLNHETIADVWNNSQSRWILDNPIPICKRKTA